MSDKEIENFEELGSAFNQAKDQTKEDVREAAAKIKADIEEFAKLAPQLPKLARQAAERGLQAQIDRINTEFGEIDSAELMNQFELARTSSTKKQESREWQDSNENRSDFVTGAVKTVEDISVGGKEAIANAAVKVTSFGAKMASLVGAKGLAKKMQEQGLGFGKKLLENDAKAVKFARTLAENGFEIADDARASIQYAKDLGTGYVEAGKETLQAGAKAVRTGATHAYNAAVQTGKNVRDAAVQTGKNVRDAAFMGATVAAGTVVAAGQAVKTGATQAYNATVKTGKDIKKGVQEYVNETRTDLGSIDQRKSEYAKTVKSDKENLNNSSKEWQTEHSDRSKIVTDTVVNIEDLSAQARANLALSAMKVATAGSKTLRLFGAKGAAKEMQSKAESFEKRLLGNKDSRFGKFFRDLVGKGFETSDTVKQGIHDAREAVEDNVKFVAGKAREGVTTARDKVVDVAETVAIGAMVGADAVRDGIKDAAETVAINAMIGKDNVVKTVKDVGETAAIYGLYGADMAKKGFLEVGKKTYKGAAHVVGVGEVLLETAGKGIETLGGNVVKAAGKGIETVREGADNIRKDVLETTEKVSDNVKNAKDTVNLRRIGLGKGIKNYLGERATAFAAKMAESIGKDNRREQELTANIAARGQNKAQKDAQKYAKNNPNKDDGR